MGEQQLARLASIQQQTIIVPEVLTSVRLPARIRLPEKDVPILLAAIDARATHLLTGDLKHFGPYMNREYAGLFIMTPGEYLRTKSTD